MTPAFHAKDGFDPYSIRLAIAREQGVSTALIKPRGGLLAGLGMPVDLRNKPLSEQAQMDSNVLFASVHGEDENRGVFWLKLREAFEDAAFYAKLSNAKSNPNAFQLSLKPIHLRVLAAVLRGRIPMVLEAHRLSDIEAAIRFKAEMQQQGHRLRIILSGASESWLARDSLAKAGIPVLLTPSKQMPSNFDRLRARDDLAYLLQEAGVRFAISSNDLNVRRLRQQAAWAASYGLEYRQALAAITSRPAEIFGIDDRGVLAAGKRADLVLWSHDPLQAQARVEALWIAGELQELETRQDRLAKRYRKSQLAH